MTEKWESTNLYTIVTDPDTGERGYRFMVDSGTFFRCRHGHTQAYKCWRCGLFHPHAYLKDVWADFRSMW